MGETIWKALPFTAKAWVATDVIVYNRVSGNTHLLNAIAARILSLAEKQPDTSRELAQRIATESQIDADEEIVGQIENVLISLDDLGLIESLN